MPIRAMLVKKMNFCNIILQVSIIAIMRALILLFFIGFTGYNICNAQPTIQKIMAELHAAKQDTNRVNVYYKLSYWYWSRNTDSALIMADSSLQLAKALGFKKGIALAYLSKGVSLESKGRYPEALNCHLQTLRLSEELNLEGLGGNAYNNIGIVYSDMGDPKNAIVNFRRSLYIMMKQQDADVASLGSLINIGEAYKQLKNTDSGIYYNARALSIARKAHDSATIATALYNIGEAYIFAKTYDSALVFLQQSLAIAAAINDEGGMAYAYSSLGAACYHLGRYAESVAYAQKSLDRSKELGIYEITKETYNVLYLNFEKQAQYDKALHFRNLEIALADSLSTADKDKQIKELQATYDLEKKQQQVDLLNKERTAQQRVINRNKLIGMLGAALFLLLAVFTLQLYKNNRIKKKLNSQLAQQNKETLETNQQLEEVNNMKNKLFSIVGHDLRGPIGSLSGMLELLNSDALSEEETHYFLTEISSSLTATRHLLNNLLYWAKSQMEGMQINATPFNVAKVIGQNIELAQNRTKEKGITLQWEEGSMIAENACADEMMIDLVIRNLVENAIKFCRKGDRIHLSATKENDFIKIAVSDTGQGIPADSQEKLFNKLITHTTFGTAQEKGSGLGLLLCKELVEKNGGAIGFTSTAGEGSIFYFTVPAAHDKIKKTANAEAGASMF